MASTEKNPVISTTVVLFIDLQINKKSGKSLSLNFYLQECGFYIFPSVLFSLIPCLSFLLARPNEKPEDQNVYIILLIKFSLFTESTRNG